MTRARPLVPTMRARYYLIITTMLLTAAGFGLRLHYLGGDNFWIDEILTLQVAQTGERAIQGGRDHPPLNYLATALSINYLGENEFAARLPAALAGTIAIPAIFVLGRLLGGPGAGLWAAFLLTLSPFHLRYSQLSRHYALLMLLSLISYIMLYRALKRPKWSYWLAYTFITTANLYTHYAALLVLGAQVFLIGCWSVAQINRGKLSDLKYPAAAIALIIVLFLPWTPRFIASLEYNVGAETVTETGTAMPLDAWLQEAYHSFGMFSEFLSAVLIILALLGLLFWMIDREWLNLGLILSGVTLPLIMILLFQVARGALPRYIIFMLPLYLVSAGFGIHRTLKLTEARAGPIVYATASIAIALAFVIVSWPILQERYRTVYYDWSNLAQFIQSQSEGEVALVAAELNQPEYLDKMTNYLPYYLDKAGLDYLLLPGSSLTKEEVDLLSKVDDPVWTIVYHQNSPPITEELTGKISQFPSDLYVIHDDDQHDGTLEEVIASYEGILAGANIPKPKCLMLRDLALLYLATEETDLAHQALDRAKGLCPDLDHWTLEPIYEGLLRGEPTDHRSEDALEIARLLLENNPKNEIALDFLTYYDLLELLESGKGQIQADDSPEPVQRERFVMPQDGDWGEVLFLHPPASVRFDLSLPDEPITFSSRIALAPESWSWGGDGVTFVLKIEPESGEEVEVFRQHVGNEPEDQKWHEVSIPLAEYAGQKVFLTLATEVGPAGDGTGDWAGWERPRIMLDLSN